MMAATSLMGAAMPALKRVKTNYPGVVYVEGVSPVTGKPERVYYIRYRRAGKQIEEKAGRQYSDDMTAARAAGLRATRIRGLERKKSNEETRLEEKAAREADDDRWTITRLWEEYKKTNPGLRGIVTDQNRFHLHIAVGLGDKEPKGAGPARYRPLEAQTRQGAQAGDGQECLGTATANHQLQGSRNSSVKIISFQDRNTDRPQHQNRRPHPGTTGRPASRR